MFDNENTNNLFTENDGLDLGSDIGDAFPDIDSIFGSSEPAMQPFTAPAEQGTIPTPAAAPTSQGEVINNEKTDSEEKKNENEHITPESGAAAEKTQRTDTGNGTEEPNIFDVAMAQAETKQAESAKSVLIDKLPVFSYANTEEEIVDTSKTFDQLRNDKADDFPELDDGTSVSWKMVYGTITKKVSTPKKTTIASFKKQIEDSKEFMTALKKAKGEIVCKVTPTVTAKQKGVIPSYKGVFNTVEDAVTSGKTIAFVPSDDGRIYEVRNNKIGTFIAKANNADILPRVRAGFIPALPKIPYKDLAEIISFFKSYVSRNASFEAMVYVYWSFVDEKYYIYVPKQKVSKNSVDTFLPEMDEDKFLLVMEIHSHNTMEAVFSSTDDKDERATRLYSVIGRLDKLFPDITTRISVGGKYVEINPSYVFEGVNTSFPEKWNEAVSISDKEYEEAESI